MITDVYETADGEIHWPDTISGSDLVYGIKWVNFLTNENDEFVSMTWDALPAGISSSFQLDSLNYSYIKLSADAVGDYIITGTMLCTEATLQQEVAIRMNLRVT